VPKAEMREAIFTSHLGFAELEAIVDAITLSPDQFWCSSNAEAACSSQYAQQQPPGVSRGKKSRFFLYNCCVLRKYLMLLQWRLHAHRAKKILSLKFTCYVCSRDFNNL
jgi:hypothetical protein